MGFFQLIAGSGALALASDQRHCVGKIGPGVLEEMRTIIPKRESGKGRKYPFTRRLTEDVGHPKLREHLASVTTIMKLSDQYDDFGVKLDRIHPRYDETLALPLFDEDGDPA